MPLDRETAYFDAHVADWLGEHEGQYVLIKGDEFSFFESDEAAYEAAIDKYGDVDVLIKQVLPEEPIEGSFSLLYGLLDASNR